MNLNKKIFFIFGSTAVVFVTLTGLILSNFRTSSLGDINSKNSNSRLKNNFSFNNLKIDQPKDLVTGNQEPLPSSPSLNGSAQETTLVENVEDLEEHGDHYHDDKKIIFTPGEISKSKETPPYQIKPIVNSEIPNIIGFQTTSLPNNSQNVSVNSPFSVTFSAPVNQSLISNLTFYPTAEFSTTQSGQTVTVYPKRLQRLTNYVFGTRAGYGICAGTSCAAGPVKWNYAMNFTTSFKEVYIYGYSILGRPLVANIYGESDDLGKKILLASGTHGEEYQAGGLWRFVDEINVNPQWILGKNKTLIIIPRVNPDGTAIQEVTRRFGSNARFNARGVNLNRNYPAQWKPCASCGPSPASEPETYNFINFVFAEKVNHMITYHSQWPPFGIIFLGADENQYTINWSYWVSSKTGYPVGIYDGPEVAGGGDVPGDQAVWGESVGIRSLLIEATYRGVDDYEEKNRNLYLGLLSEDVYSL